MIDIPMCFGLKLSAPVNEVPLGVVELVEEGGPLNVPAPGEGEE